MSNALLEMYETLDDESKGEVDNLIRSLFVKKNVKKTYSYEEKMKAAEAIRGLLTHEEAEEMRASLGVKFKEYFF